MELWKGIEAIQFLRDGHSIKFTLRASLLLMIHDLPAYGTLTGLTVHGHGSSLLLIVSINLSCSE